MKFASVILSLVFVGSMAQAQALPGSDDLSGLVSGSGIYSRSLLTDIEDGNGSVLCRHIVKAEVSVDVANKRLAYVLTQADKNDQLSERGEIIKVGQDSLRFTDFMNGIRIYTVNGVQANSVVRFELSAVLSSGAHGEWEAYSKRVEFSAGKVKIDKCTFRRVQ